MKNAREYLTEIYLDWLNNYASTVTFAEHNGITTDQALVLITLAKSVFESDHPDM